jgi:hypothetical protein
MPIRAPRLLPFARRKRCARRNVGDASIRLSSLIDVLVVIAVFLLTTFDAPDECGCRRPVSIPGAENTAEMLDAPLVQAAFGHLLVDGAWVSDLGALEESDRVHRVDALFDRLTAMRALWKQTHPGRGFPGAVVLEIEASVPAQVVKSVFLTSALAGYPNESFVVQRIAATRNEVPARRTRSLP